MDDFLAPGYGYGDTAVLTDGEAALLPFIQQGIDAGATLRLKTRRVDHLPYTINDSPLRKGSDFWGYNPLNNGATGKLLKCSNNYPPVRLADPDRQNVDVLQQRQAGYGGVYRPSIIDTLTGLEVNDLPNFAPGAGWCLLAGFRVADPNTTMHGFNYGSNTGGALLGGKASAPARNPAVIIDPGTGYLIVYNQYGTGSPVQYQFNTPFRGATYHMLAIMNNPAAGAIRVWEQAGGTWTNGVYVGGAVVEHVGITGSGVSYLDVAAPSGPTDQASRAVIGGVDIGNDDQFTGEIGEWLLAPGTWLLSDTARAAAFAVLAGS